MNKFSVIGNPINHSLSPMIHQEFAKEFGIDLSYEKILSPVESAWMAAVLPNPRDWTRRLAPDHVRARQIKVLDTLPHVRIVYK